MQNLYYAPKVALYYVYLVNLAEAEIADEFSTLFYQRPTLSFIYIV